MRSTGAGQIKEVHVTNFMCHANMRVDFTPHVNFISGPNGSGKSAILQALQYCLGVRAAQTGRASSNVQYIKEHCDFCTAAARLCSVVATTHMSHLPSLTHTCLGLFAQVHSLLLRHGCAPTVCVCNRREHILRLM